MLRTRDTNINSPSSTYRDRKVIKSHIDIYHEVADEGARYIATADEVEPDVIFDEADPPIGGAHGRCTENASKTPRPY